MSVAAILKAKGSHVETTRPDTTVYTVIWALKLKGIGALVVTEDGATVLGRVSERDIVQRLTERGAKLLTSPVSELMTTPATCTRDEPITSVMARMTRLRVRHLPVVDGGKLCGIVSIGDVVKHRLDEYHHSAFARWTTQSSCRSREAGRRHDDWRAGPGLGPHPTTSGSGPRRGRAIRV